MMECFHFITGERRQIAFFANAAETMPSQEAPETEEGEKMDSPDKTPEKVDKETDNAMTQMMKRIEKGDTLGTSEADTLRSTEKFRNSLGREKSASDVNDALSTASNDAGDAAQESADIALTAGLNDISPDIGKKLASNETPKIPGTDAATNEARPAERTTEAEGAQRDAEQFAQKNEQVSAPSENPDSPKAA